ncbi:MAG: DUF5686 family protein [Bacteroidota bacterium]|nr:DUF5686 family protein [Bacteroidota bacterium]MDP4231959.1 DUF5686 family protein [Bacteroidota bacterium]MDP4241334.1 DUF5686 family protein [Bacteroidota bacterium]MDP4287255.1 DUF5686 family protein [Bacteroidota bacterium]
MMNTSGRVALVLLIALLTSASHAQQVELRGRVTIRGTGEEIPGASLAIMGTPRGAKANREGAFLLKLDRNVAYRIRVTAIGYKPDTLSFTLAKDSSCEIALRESPVTGATITISADASRKEARRIIQKVIDTKDAWQAEIKDYRFHVYGRLNARILQDTSSKIFAIIETVADGFWKQGKGYAERVTARKQTANLPGGEDYGRLFDVDNFYNERIDFLDYSLTSPVAHDAFDAYDYDLIGDGELNGAPVYKISVEPRGVLNPAFQGTLWIDQTDYTIAYLELAPNDAVKIGPIKNISISQTFGFVENKYWMPSQLTFGFSVKLDMPFVPAFRLDENAMLQDYTINGDIADSVFSKRHAVAPTADSVDSLHWASERLIPLASDEDKAYRKYDSIAKLPPPPPGSALLKDIADWLPGLDVYSFNRVEGSRFQWSHSIRFSDAWPLSMDGSVGYGLGDRRWKYSLNLEQGLTWATSKLVNANVSLGGDVSLHGMKTVASSSSSFRMRLYDNYVRRGQGYAEVVNTLTALLLHSDYPDYFRARGFDVTYSNHLADGLTGAVSFTNENEYSLSTVTDYSLLLSHNTFRANPAIDDGRLHAIGAALTKDFYVSTWSGSATVQIDYADSVIGSQFTFATASAHITLEGKDGVWGKAWFDLAASDLLRGTLPNQSLFYFESRNSVITSRSVFRTMSPLEFQGDRTWSAMFEQNFYDLPTRFFGLHSLTDLQWIGFASLAGATLTDASANHIATAVMPILNQPFVEAGFGIGNILNIFRFDAAWRLTHKTNRNFFVTGTLAISF